MMWYVKKIKYVVTNHFRVTYVGGKYVVSNPQI